MKKLSSLVICMCLLVSLSQATVDFDVPSGGWFVASNWNPVGIPTPGDDALINDGRVCSFGGSVGSVQSLQVGVGSDGTLNMSSGTLTTGNVDKSLWIGNGDGTGYLTMTGGQIISNSRIAIGGDFDDDGSAVLNLSNDAKITQQGGIGHAVIGYSLTSVVDITMSDTSEIAFTNLTSSQYVDLRLGDITINQSGSSRFYSSGNIRTGVSSTTSNAVSIEWTLTGGTIEADAGIHLYDDSHIYLGGDSQAFAAYLAIFDTCTIDISGDALLNVKDRTIEQLEAMFGNEITGTGLAARTVTIEGVEYTQVYVPEPATLILLASGMLVLKKRRD